MFLKSMKFIFIKILLLFFFSFQLKAQNRYVYNSHDEFSVSLPGKIYYDNFKKDGLLIYETLASEDFEAELSVHKGNSYEYLTDFSNEFYDIISEYGYREVKSFSKGKLSDEINYEFRIGYSPEDKSTVIFGLIQDSYKRKLYEFSLFCFDIDIKIAKEIINSIQIN
jgi:hypothetical protein